MRLDILRAPARSSPLCEAAETAHSDNVQVTETAFKFDEGLAQSDLMVAYEIGPTC